MDIIAKFHGSCRAEIRRLLVITGMVVAVMVVFQSFSLVTNKGSIVMMVVGNSNTSVVNMSTSTKLDVAVASDEERLEPDMDRGLMVGVENYPNHSFYKLKGENSFNKGVTDDKSLNMGYATSLDNSSTETEAMEIEHGKLEKVEKVGSTYNFDDDPKATAGLELGGVQNRASPGDFTAEVEKLDVNSTASESISAANLSSTADVRQTTETQPMNPKVSKQPPASIPTNNLSAADISILKRWNRRPTSISKMDLLLLQSRVSSRSMRPSSSSVRDRELLSAKVEIENAPVSWNTPELHASVFRNVSIFKRSYELMESLLKVYIYKEGEKPIFHQPIMRGIYASEGWFMKLMEGNRKFVAPKFTGQHLRNCIKALCNADVSKGFKIGMDTSLPVTYIRSAEAPLDNLGGNPPLKRSTLAFFAGRMHGYLRPILLNFWENKVDDMKIFGPMPHDVEGKRIYREHMKSSKYCICARGYEVHTPRVVEAIFYECVPVIISDNYVPPFFEVLNWEAFSVFVQEKDIPNLRNILLSIPEERYLAMQSRVKMVQKHFLWHKKPKKYDIFHMVLHSIWYNRLFNTRTK
ncbi:glycosyltransferase family exostosin protein [Citrus sinensis]|uniref:Glycosyltransferase family exostosin protein n=1 Tax=Citrus sinensis TaxID=2711 RepID=A0ACB8NT14_CITSI|nr:glycosyltransferase family exostosin protein [Citrus sinensis]KAH9800886.1 glycosyltransferase family exostosin protein [Citrus sinensis]